MDLTIRSLALRNFLSFCFLVLTSVDAECKSLQLSEASGVTCHGSSLPIVSDDEPGAYFRSDIRGRSGPTIPITPDCLVRHHPVASDPGVVLEPIDVLADGRAVILSECLRSLLARGKMVAEYDNPLAEIGNRGLGGVAVGTIDLAGSEAAVVWRAAI